MKALSKDKAQRYPNAGALAKALEPIAGPGTARRDTPAPASGSAASSAPGKKSALKILFWAAVLVALSILSGLGVLFLLKGSGGAPK